MYYLHVWRNGEWQLIGQYPDRKAASRIAADYRRRGERVKVTSER